MGGASEHETVSSPGRGHADGSGEQFTKGKVLTVRYTPSGKGGADIPIRLEGLTDALKFLPK